MAHDGSKHSPLAFILNHAYGFWASATLASGFRHRIFDHLAAGATDVSTLAEAAKISPRGCQALLDGLLGLALVQRTQAGYSNVTELEDYLISTGANYIGGYADAILSTMADWSKLPEAVATGKPLHRREAAGAESSFWERMVRGIAPVAFEPARAAAEQLGIAKRGALRVLDIGGGAGAYALVWLGLNPSARCTQIDAPAVNRIAKAFVSERGLGDRFETLDGDMESLELEPSSYDVAIYSNMSHGLSPERNERMFRRIRGWLKPGGTLVLSCMMPTEERTGQQLLLLVSLNLLLNSEAGSTYVRSDYSAWLGAAGFTRTEFVPVTNSVSTLIFAS
jgi:SAM-dependent methyltransferase